MMKGLHVHSGGCQCLHPRPLPPARNGCASCGPPKTRRPLGWAHAAADTAQAAQQDASELDLLARQLSGFDASTSESVYVGSRLDAGSDLNSSIRVSATNTSSSSSSSSRSSSHRPVPRAADKVNLTKQEAREVSRRLREVAPQPGTKVLKVYRYAIDDLRLLKVLNQAGLEGLVTVVDTVAAADVVLATRSKRTGKVVDLAPVRRAAAAAGLPFVQLRAVSAVRVLEALAPLLGLEQQVADAQEEARGSRQGPKLLRQEELAGDGSDALLALLWGLGRESGLQAQEALWEARVAAMPDPHAWLVADLEDTSSRDELLPANPTARAGNKHALVRPIRHGSRQRRQEVQQFREDMDAPW